MSLRNAVGFVRRKITATDKIVGAVEFPAYSFAELPSATENTEKVLYCSDGNNGQPCLVRSDGSDWICLATGDVAADAP